MPAAVTSPRPTLRRDVWCGLLVVGAAAVVRWPRMGQSLWYDEMTTLVSYVLQPWSRVLAPAAGEYVPNNHVLHTVLAKLIYTAVTGGRSAVAAGEPVREAVLRLPAFVAGCLLPVALAWPLRRRSPLAAAAVAAVAVVHPWLVELSAEARGYTLMLLLGVVATNALAARTWRGWAGYTLAVAGAVYTVPLAGLLVPGHALAVWFTRRDAVRRWAVAAVAAGLLSTALYGPMARGLAAYYRHPFTASTDYRGFLDALPRHALAGQRLPVRPVDPSLPAVLDRLRPDPPGSSIYWALPVLVMVAGTALGWTRVPDARPLLATLATAAVLAALLPVVLPAATEVRFDTWTAPWFALAVSLLLAAIATGLRPAAVGWSVSAVAAGLLVVQMVRWDVAMLPNQPVREAMAAADRLAPPGRSMVVAYLGADETVLCYGNSVDRAVLPAPDTESFRDLTDDAEARTGRRPWVVVLFEAMARDRHAGLPGTGDLWPTLTAHYHLAARLPGRLTPVAVYAPDDDGRPPATRPVALTPRPDPADRTRS